MLLSLCNDWEFSESWSDAFAQGQGEANAVRLPHTVKELPLHYADHNRYQMLCGYRRQLHIPAAYASKRLFLHFDGAAHIATVYVNGEEVGHHRSGYTAFRCEITDHVAVGEDALISVKLDTTENPDIPPFGFVIDYLTYGGLYREVWLDVREQNYIEDVFLTTQGKEANVAFATQGANLCRLSITELDGTCLLTKETTSPARLDLPEAKLWSTEDPHRYILKCELLNAYGEVVDIQEVKFGFRDIDFREDGFYLNGKKTFLRGLNRHQCYPYIGYAAPESLQREDARILKQELGCVAVRTSHYPQSQHFIDECDRLGLLVFTEIPGWQHIGDAGWKEQACENTKEMVLQYRNHPSIILWGVRINESQDCDELYELTNAIAHELDPSRPTSGVRYLEKSHLIEDVYSFNDFSHTGNNAGVRPKQKVAPTAQSAIIISEHNGHMFPTKSFDPWQKRQEHALRHAQVLNDAMADGNHAGCFGWCMFDYPTHKDFGSGDRACYHGVMDAFRNPKLAAAVYAAQQEEKPVLAVGSSMDIGDYPGGQLGDVYVFTNATGVSLYKNGNFVSDLCCDDWNGMDHPLLQVEDTVGCLLETQECFDKKKAALLRKCLVAIGKKGLAGLSPADYLRMGYAMVRYKLTYDDAVKLYGKYIGNWGNKATVWRFDAKNGDEVVASVTCCPSSKLHLEVTSSATQLEEKQSYDMAAVRVRVLDEFGNIAPYAQLPVKLQLKGAAELVGPDVITAEGGMTGTYIRTIGKTGIATLSLSTAQTESVTIQFTVQ